MPGGAPNGDGMEGAVQAAASLVASETGASRAKVHLVDAEARVLVPVALIGRTGLLSTLPSVPLDPVYEAASVFLSGMAVAVSGTPAEDGDTIEGVARWRAGMDTGSHVVLPIGPVEDRLGTLTLRWDEPRDLTEADVAALLLGTRALEAPLRALRESRLGTTPSRPTPPETQEAGLRPVVRAFQLVAADGSDALLDVAVGYLAADGQRPAAFHDVFQLPSGGVAMVVGRLGTAAADPSLVAMLHDAVRTHAVARLAPDAVLGRTNEALVRFSGGSGLASVFFGVLDPARRLLTYASAGACPPLLMRVDGGVTPLARPQPIMGAFSAVGYVDRLQLLVPGDVVLAYAVDASVAAPVHGCSSGDVTRAVRSLHEPRDAVAAALLSSSPEATASPGGAVALAVRLR